MVAHAITEGLAKEAFDQLPTPLDALAHVDAVPADHFFELHEFLDQKLGPSFSIRVGQHMKIDDYGVLGLSWRTCSWAGEIFERSERYFKLLSNTYVFKVEKGKEVATVYLLREPHRRGVELSNEATISATVVVLQAMTEQQIFPIKVSFKHDAPQKLDDFNKAFQCPVLFNQAFYAITYTTKDLETRTAKADKSINTFLLDRVEEETNGIEISAAKIVADLEKLVKDALPSGIPSISQLGSHMGMSNRTLTRRLSEHGFTYRELLQKTQQNISIQLLKNSADSIGEIAFQVGFSEQSAFNRAFKNWTGHSPSDYRKLA